MKNETELETLKQEIARLRREMNELKQFIRYNPPGEGDDGEPQAAYITIDCAIFRLIHPSTPNLSRVNMMGHKEGAFIAVLGDDERTRVLLQVEKNIPEVSILTGQCDYQSTMTLEKGLPQFNLYGPGGKLAVQLRAEDEAGRGVIGVCEAGKPRAVMKATELGAAISAVHDDGHARITMTSSENNGELFAVTPDMKVGVKIMADGLDGGVVTVNNHLGKAGVIISNTPVGGAVIVQDNTGKITGHLPADSGE